MSPTPDNPDRRPRRMPSELNSLLVELSRIPYENLSKIAALAERGSVSHALRPEESLELKGGTCYALTYALHHRMNSLGLPTRFLMADQIRRSNVHCGLLFEWEGGNYLLDPGYLIFEALPLPGNGLSLSRWIAPNEVILQDIPQREVWRLFSGKRGEVKHRFDFRRNPVSEGEFMRHWRESYLLEMMDYPVLNKSEQGVQYYLQKRNLVIRTAEGSEMRRLDRAGLTDAALRIFGLERKLIETALEALLRKNQGFFRL